MGGTMTPVDILKKRKESNEGLIKEFYLSEQKCYRELYALKDQIKDFQIKKSQLNKENKEIQEVIDILQNSKWKEEKT